MTLIYMDGYATILLAPEAVSWLATIVDGVRYLTASRGSIASIKPKTIGLIASS